LVSERIEFTTVGWSAADTRRTHGITTAPAASPAPVSRTDRRRAPKVVPDGLVGSIIVSLPGASFEPGAS
jgi:hypothetical protein